MSASGSTPRFWADLSTVDFTRLPLDRTIAVLPVAAIEQHGPHLPLSVDATLLEGIIHATLPLLPAQLSLLFLPTQAVGKSDEHLRFPGTLSLRAETLIALWTELGECVARAGVRKLVLLNSHGGQVSVMDIVARRLRVEQGLLTFGVNWFTLPLGEQIDALFTAEEHRFGIHAGDVETSMMLALAPHHVNMHEARHFSSSSQQRAETYPILGNGKSAKMGWQTQDYNPAGAMGNATLASAAKGRAVVAAAAQALAQLLSEIDSLPLSTLVDAPNFDR
jgi:creatinine amidohydrolase